MSLLSNQPSQNLHWTWKSSIGVKCQILLCNILSTWSSSIFYVKHIVEIDTAHEYSSIGACQIDSEESKNLIFDGNEMIVASYIRIS